MSMVLALLFAEVASAASLDRSSVPAAGQQSALVEVEDFGRYALIASHDQGPGLQLVDRMTGPSAIVHTDPTTGRIDAFLERGTYKLITHGDPGATGETSLTVTQYRELSEPSWLVAGKPLTTRLGDLEQRSYWIDLPGKERVHLEAVGRHVGALHVWADGTWLVPEEASCTEHSAVTGQPLQDCTLSVTLDSGLYRVVVYGGPGAPWAMDEANDDMTLRWGIPPLPSTGRQRGYLPDTGLVRFMAHENTDFFRLELPENAPVSMTVKGGEHAPYAGGGQRESISDQHRFPVVEIRDSGAQRKAVTLRGPPGQPFLLHAFEKASNRQLITADRWFLATVPGAHRDDIADPTGILVDSTPEGLAVNASQGIPIRGDTHYTRRFNVQSTTTVLLQVDSSSTYAITAGPDTLVKVEPFVARLHPSFESPDYAESFRDSLREGLWKVSIKPDKDAAIANLNIQGDSWTNRVRELVLGENDGLAIQRPNVQFPDLTVNEQETTLFLLGSPEATTGLILRPWPLDLADPLTLSLMPGEQLPLDVVVPWNGALEARDERGEPVEISLDGGTTWQTRYPLTAGPVSAILRQTGDEPLFALLRVVPEAWWPETPLPRVALDDLDLPEFPVISAVAPQFTDLDRTSSATWRIDVDNPGLYRLTSSGLLSMRGTVRTRTRPKVFTESTNGPGRNFLVDGYLRSGDYQLTTETLGKTRGHFGVHLDATVIHDGGALTHDTPARATVGSGEALQYTFTLDEDARVHLASYSLTETLLCRFEDADGWPIMEPVSPCDQHLDLDRGSYRVLVLPTQVASQWITTLDVQRQPTPVEGHGPHPLALSDSVRHRWVRQGDDDEQPDVWTVDVPARVDAKITLSEEMAGELKRAGDATVVARMTPGRAWHGELEAGTYEAAVRPARKNPKVAYTLQIATEQLVNGQRRSLSIPGTVELSVGQREIITVGSRGKADVRARLLDDAGNLVAVNDDRPDDWNFLLTARLDPGTYTLSLDKMGGPSDTVDVRMDRQSEQSPLLLTLGQAEEHTLGDDVLQWTLEPHEGVLVATAQAHETIGLAVEAKVNGAWHTLGQDAGTQAVVPARLGATTEARVRVWSLDRRGGPLTVLVDSPKTAWVKELGMSGGTRLRPGKVPLGAVAIDGTEPGLFALSRVPDAMLCPAPDAPCEPQRTDVVPVNEPGAWLVGPRQSLRGQRVRLGAGESVTARVGPAPARVDIVRHVGPTVLIARATAGRPAVAFGDDPSPSTTTLSHRGAISVDTGAEARATVWSGDDTPIDVSLTATTFLEPAAEPWVFGRLDGSLAPGSARRIALPGDARDLLVSLNPGAVAQVGQVVVWADGRSHTQRLRDVGDILTLYNPEDTPVLYSIDVLPTTNTVDSLPFERVFAHAGTLRLEVPAGSGTLYARGSIEQLDWMGRDGRVASHAPLDASAGGILTLRHAPGAALVWTDSSTLWPTASMAGTATPIDRAGQIALSGTATALEVTLDGPGMVHLRAPCPFAVRNPAVGDVQVRDTGGSADLWLPEGTATLELRSLAGTALFGDLEVTSSVPVDIGEGLGPQVLIGAGQTRLFRFETTRDGRVGVGVNADADRVVARVLTPDGDLVGQGVLQMLHLKAGTWLLALSQPEAGAPVRVQPALAGVDAPDTGPPDDVIRRYLRTAGRLGEE